MTQLGNNPHVADMLDHLGRFVTPPKWHAWVIEHAVEQLVALGVLDGTDSLLELVEAMDLAYATLN